jgi:proteic killer suppression protein
LADLLDRLNASSAVKDMNFPGSGLHQLKGKLRGYWSVKVSGNWRVMFLFKNGDAFDVDYVDYH